MALTLPQVTDVCNPHTMLAKPCRYLAYATRSDGSWVAACTKLAAKEYDKLKANRLHHVGTEDQMGDNCPGYTYLLHKLQGYNV